MGISEVGASEPTFVGEQRHQLVDRLLAEFDQVCQSRTPAWWSLEGDSGCGKTRVVQELYRRLAAERQDGEQYWPRTFLTDSVVAKAAGPPLSMRKRVYPEHVRHEPESVPQWFWWGISCSSRSGTAVQALSDDLTQFATHKVGLEQRWRQLVSPGTRHRAGLSSQRGEVFETAAGELLGVTAGLQNLALPGMRVLTLAAQWSSQGGPDRRLAIQASPVVNATKSRRLHLVDELAPALERLAAAGVPLVLTIDDLHLADASLVELVARLLAAEEAPVLVISTALPDLLE